MSELLEAVPAFDEAKLAFAARLLETIGKKDLATRLSADEEVFVQDEDWEPDLATCGDPDRMPIEALFSDILVPALKRGKLSGISGKAHFKKYSAALSEPQLRFWAGEVLRANPWPYDFHVPTFHEFIVSPEYLYLNLKPTERQMRFTEALGSDAWDWFVYPRKIQLIILCLGKGCKDGDTLLKDYRSGETRTMREWASDGRTLLVKSWDGERVVYRPSSPVYRKGRAGLFRITLDDGRKDIVTDEHRYYSQDGWRCLKDLQIGCGILTLSKPSSDRERALSGSEIASDSTGGYRVITSIEPVGEGDFFDLTVPGTECYFDSEEILNHNSGKDLISACILAYTAYVVNHMRNPWHHFRVPFGTMLDCINVAESGTLAKDIFFASYLEPMLQMPCFEGLLDQRPGKDILTEKVTFWRKMPQRRQRIRAFRILSLNSKSESVEGKNTFLWVMDEADAFKTADGHANARQMFMKLSTSNRFANRQIGIIISYPRSKNGFMFAMLKECGNVQDPTTGEYGKRKNAWGDKAATYEVLPFKVYIPCLTPMPDPLNPGRIIEEAYTNPVGYVGDTPDSSMQAFYENDIKSFRAVYECDPPAAEDAFLSNPEKIGEAVQAGLRSCIEPLADVEDYISTDLAGGMTYRYVAKRLSNLRWRPGVTYYIGGDGGAKQDSFTICISHAVDPQEKGAICPSCWADRSLRRKKHYLPRPVPGLVLKHAGQFACDYCRNLPDEKEKFWGVSLPQGRRIERPVIKGYNQAGQPVWEDEVVFDETLGREVRRQKLETVFLPLIQEDLLLEWLPDEKEGLVVDFDNVTEVLLQLCSSGQVGMVKIDQWQAEEKIQRVRRAGYAADAQQMSNPEQLKGYRNYKDLLNSNLIMLLPNPERDRQLQELQGGETKIDHPKESEVGKGKKDLPDAEMISFQLAVQYGSRMGIILGPEGDRPGQRDLTSRGEHLAQSRKKRQSVVGEHLKELGIRNRR